MRFTIYLIGYGNQVPADFLKRLELAGDQVLVIDVRSRRKSWARSYTTPQVEYLFKKAGHDYLWLPELGGDGHDGIGEAFGMMALEIQIRKQHLPVVLMCAERLSSRCHRTRVAEELRQRLELAGDQLDIRPL